MQDDLRIAQDFTVRVHGMGDALPSPFILLWDFTKGCLLDWLSFNRFNYASMFLFQTDEFQPNRSCFYKFWWNKYSTMKESGVQMLYIMKLIDPLPLAPDKSVGQDA